MSTPRVALYARVSTSDGDQNPEVQLTALEDWAKAQNVVLDRKHVYVDLASGTATYRARLEALLEDAHRREFDEVWIFALDRLSREGIAKCSMILERLKAAGVRVRSLKEPWMDTVGPVADLLIAVLAWVAQQERERIRERVRAGIRHAKRHGTKTGRPIGGQRLILDESALAVYVRRHGVRAAARKFHCSPAHVRAVRKRRPDLFAPINGTEVAAP